MIRHGFVYAEAVVVLCIDSFPHRLVLVDILVDLQYIVRKNGVYYVIRFSHQKNEFGIGFNLFLVCRRRPHCVYFHDEWRLESLVVVSHKVRCLKGKKWMRPF